MPVLKYWDSASSSWKTGAVGLPSGQVYSQIIGDGVNTSFTVTHGFGTRNVIVAVYRNTPPYEEVEVDVERTDVNTVTIRTLPTIPGVSEYIVNVNSAGTQATLNITMDTWHSVGAAGEPAFANSWVNFDTANYGSAGFRKYPDGRVRLRGLIKSGTIPAGVFTLPVGYRPPKQLLFACDTNPGAMADVRIQTDGQVVVQTGSVTWVALDNVEFDTESVLQTASVAAQPLDSWHTVGASGEPAFAPGGWANYGGAEATVAFRKDPWGRVLLRGLAKSGPVPPCSVFTLPAGYRPPAVVRFAVIDGSSTAYVYVDTAGVVTLYSTTGTRAGLDFSGVEFDTETVGAYATGVIPAVTAVPPEVKFYGDGGVTGDIPTPTWDVTHTDGSPVSISLMPTIDCWWMTSCNVLAKTTSAVWSRLQLNLMLTPADVDGHNIANGSIMCHSSGSDWNEGSVQRAWKLAKGVAYNLKLNVQPVGGTYQIYRHNNHLWLAHDGIRPR